MTNSSRSTAHGIRPSRTIAPALGYDLNDLYYFVQVVDYGGFAAAGRVLQLPKSRLSRRIAVLEQRLGVKLIHRSTRSFSTTEYGQAYYARCKTMLAEVEAAQALIESVNVQPRGTVRLSCPIVLLHTHVGAAIIAFAARYPEIKIELVGMNRRTDVIRERLDIALYSSAEPFDTQDLVVRVLGHAAQCLVASPALCERLGRPLKPTDLRSWPSLGSGLPARGHVWSLTDPSGTQISVHYDPRFVTTDLLTLRKAAVAGLGVAQLPMMMVRDQLDDGALLRILPHWSPRRDAIHAVFSTRKGMPTAVRLLLDFLAQRFEAVEDA
ncbi:LysR substrate-binding domain-containing protein [Burkholderia sp. BCC1977]|uniref:LysR substrate-binding domain-containing protein n=1 Tax=Burkholderia sp. BCC1977 TaxID=2817440 RepID=UPI002ABE0E31|nr:LysR substrate-binding domain-containing protein [Burkholderia sp. BCC1977]